ncbi:hypothetical protein J41TS2_24470 [Bacillus sonorensis]|uniref:hypothetical protein n=1 Tax=Bacillus sonorensis TaxID=119858 RepID=UPI001B108E72|nr:hypothetical protein [Bacillus sonorensis]GIN67026.1 hypothetical protein J41TS2_24470 [Bacillus sonorensis]
MSKKIPRIREASDIVFKKHAKGINVFMITKNNGKGCIDKDIQLVTKNEVEFELLNGQKVTVFDENNDVIAINFLDNV